MLYRSIMSDPLVDEIQARVSEDGTKFQLKWKTAAGPYHYRWFPR